MKRTSIIPILLLAVVSCFAQSKKEVFHLWADTPAPTYNGITKAEENHGLYVENVTDPMLTVYVPEKPNGLAVIACPGGSIFRCGKVLKAIILQSGIMSKA